MAVVTIQDQILAAMDVNEEQFLLEIAILLYKEDKLSQLKATELAGLSRLDFEYELGKRKISKFNIEDFKEDIKNLKDI